jgi:Erv1 / Alr family
MNLNTMFGRINQKTINQNYNTTSNIRPNIMALKYNSPQQIKPMNQPVGLINENAIKSSNTMTWGKPTWYFLHTLAEKIKIDDFHTVRVDLLDIVYSICTNLPCPDCANHAKTYLDKINFNTIQTKEDFKMMLFVFHNFVNQRKGYEIFTVDQLNELYSTANTSNIINNFLTTYLKKNPTPKMIANDMFRRRIVVKTKDWLNTNSTKFTP